MLIKCATLAWKALEKGTVAKEGKAEGTTGEDNAVSDR